MQRVISGTHCAARWAHERRQRCGLRPADGQRARSAGPTLGAGHLCQHQTAARAARGAGRHNPHSPAPRARQHTYWVGNPRLVDAGQPGNTPACTYRRELARLLDANSATDARRWYAGTAATACESILVELARQPYRCGSVPDQEPNAVARQFSRMD
jgi:hypothetical protein